MTEENKIANIKSELERAGEFLAASELLAKNRLLNDAVSRLYYYLLSYIRALLLTEGIEAKSHEGALRLVGLHFIKTEILGPPVSHILSKLMKYREEADYNPAFIFREEDYLQLRNEAKVVVHEIEDYFRKKSYQF